MRDYHVGLLKDGACVIVQLRSNKDLLDCETWRYLGLRQTTKKLARANREKMLDWINQTYGTQFTKIAID